MDFLQRAKELEEELVNQRRFLHQHPEIGMELPVATQYVMDRLREFGYEPQELPHGGVTAQVGQGKRCILLRADMDALPMQEESGLPYASQIPGKAHTCGHDMHTSMLLGAARMLKEREAELQGVVKLMFQPGEETNQGARSMIEDGILEHPHVDAALAMHMIPMVPTGVIAYTKGTAAASNDILRITVKGKGGHGAHPGQTIDPINVGAHIHIALQELLSRELDPEESAVLTFGTFHAGTKENIIPSEAVLTGTLRTYKQEVREFLLERIRDMVQYTAKTFRAEAEMEVLSSVPPLTSDGAVVDAIAAGWKKILPEKMVLELDRRMSGSEDFAEVSQRVPSMCFVLGGGTPQQGCCYGVHHPKLRYDEACLPVGAAAYAQGAMAWLAQAKQGE